MRKVRTSNEYGTYGELFNIGGRKLMESATENNRPPLRKAMAGKGENER